jgi:hypothetical protein
MIHTDSVKAWEAETESYRALIRRLHAENERLQEQERERCAKICDDLAHENRLTRKGEGASLCAARIRAND